MSEQQTEDQKRNDKKGGAAPWMQGSANVGSGSLGGASAQGASGGMLATLKAAMGPKLMLTAILGGGATMGAVIGMQDYSIPQDPNQAVFSARAESPEMGEMIVEERDDGSFNALELARQANSGAYGMSGGDGGEAQAEGEVEESASAEGVETAEDAADAPGAIPGMDPDALAQMAEGLEGEENSNAAKERLGQKFGKLSASLGGSSGGGPKLAGGAGLSGGIGGAFKQKELSNRQLGKLRGAQGSRKVSRTKTAARGQKGGKRKGAFNRVNRMSKAMGNARTGSAAETAATHSQQWDASGDTGESITGAGASGIGAGGESEFSGDEGTTSGNPLTPTNSGSGSGSGPEVKDIKKSKNVTPYQQAMDMMIGLVMLANVIILILGIVAAFKKTGVGAVIGEGISQALFGIVMLLMAAVTVGALMIGNQYGQSGQANLLASAAAVTGVTAGFAMWNEWVGKQGWVLILGGIAGIGLTLGGLSKSDQVHEDKVRDGDAYHRVIDYRDTKDV